MRSAVAAALGLNIFNRQADKLYMCNIAQMVNVLQSLMLTDGPEGKNCVRTTSYYAFMLFKPHRGKKAVKVEYDGYRLPTAPQGGRGGGGRGVPQAPPPPPDLSMSASRQGSEMVLTFVNPRHDIDMDVECTLRGVTRQAGPRADPLRLGYQRVQRLRQSGPDRDQIAPGGAGGRPGEDHSAGAFGGDGYFTGCVGR